MTTLVTLFNKWESNILDYSPKLILAILVLIAFYFMAKFARKTSLQFYSRIYKEESEIAQIISVILYCVILFFGVFSALELLGLESILAKMITSAGIIGIIAGFAFKDIASNAFAGFLLNIEKPFKKDDWVEIDDKFGVVRNINLITTSIQTISGQEVFVPNQIIYNTFFTNYSTSEKRRVILKSGVSYGDDLDLVKSSALDEVNKISAVLKNEPIDFYFTEIGSSSYNFELRFWINFREETDYLSAMSETIMRIKKRFEQEDISLAYSVMTLDFGVKGGVNLFDKPIEVKD